MKSNKIITFLLTFAFFACFVSTPLAQEPQETQETDEIEQAADEVDELAESTPEGEQVVQQKIKDRFVVNDEVITDLREKEFGYGEIATTLSLAERMEGGINDTNIQKIVELRSGEAKAGWGNIAKEFDVTVGDLRRDIRAVNPQAQNIADTPDTQTPAADIQQSNKSEPPKAKGAQINSANQEINRPSAAGNNMPRGTSQKPSKIPKGK